MVRGETRGLSPKSVHNIHVMLNKAMGDAARKCTVIRNVVALADALSLQARKRPETKAWEVAQLVAFLDAIASHRMAPAFHFGAHTGMRRGEVLGMRWVCAGGTSTWMPVGSRCVRPWCRLRMSSRSRT